MNTIGKAPLESLKYLTRRKFNISRKFETKIKKNKAQIFWSQSDNIYIQVIF